MKRAWWQYAEEPSTDRTITVHEGDREPSRLLDSKGRPLSQRSDPPGFHSPRSR